MFLEYNMVPLFKSIRMAASAPSAGPSGHPGHSLLSTVRNFLSSAAAFCSPVGIVLTAPTLTEFIRTHIRNMDKNAEEMKLLDDCLDLEGIRDRKIVSIKYVEACFYIPPHGQSKHEGTA